MKVIHPIRQKLNALCLPMDVIIVDKRYGPNSFLMLSIIDRNELALPLVSGRLTLFNLAHSIGSDNIVNTPAENKAIGAFNMCVLLS